MSSTETEAALAAALARNCIIGGDKCDADRHKGQARRVLNSLDEAGFMILSKDEHDASVALSREARG